MRIRTGVLCVCGGGGGGGVYALNLKISTFEDCVSAYGQYGFIGALSTYYCFYVDGIWYV